jgi:DNA adenine methylase
MRTPLTYYGGKQKLAGRIVAAMPSHSVYLEPFCGGAAVLFAKPKCERETLNDRDGQIMRFWRAVRDRPAELAHALALTPYSRAEWRASREPADDDVEAARRLLVNVDQSFIRNREGWSCPSMLPDRRGRWQPSSWEGLPVRVVAAATRLREVCLESKDALELIPRWDVAGAVIYCDPPYTGPDRTEPRHGYAHDDDALWDSLVPLLLGVENAHVLLSGYPCDAARPLVASGWSMVGLPANRGARSPVSAPETLWLSPSIRTADRQLFDTLEPA